MARGKTKKELTIEEKLEQALVPVEDQPYNVPENWCWSKLNYIGKWGSGGTPSRKQPKYYTGNIPWIKTGELLNDYIYDSEEHITQDAVDNSSAKLFPIGTVAIAMYGATIGKVGLLGVEATTNQACACCICNKICNNRWLFWYLQSQKDVFVEKGKGGAQPNISQETIRNHYLPLPPLAEQQRIVNRIESLFAKLDEVKEKLEAVVESYETRKAAILHKAFTGELTKKWRKDNNISNEWNSAKISELGLLERGKSKHRPRNDARLFGGEYPFIQTGDVGAADVYVTSHSQTLSEFGLQQSRLFPKGTLCITIAANIGKVAILSYDCCFPDSVVGFTPNGRTLSKYMYYAMSEIQKELEASAPATAQKNFSLKLLSEVMIKVPTIEEQNVIVQILDNLLNSQKAINDYSKDIIEQIDSLKKSVLARAFRGELGTNDPTEESSIELLRQILSEK